MTELSDNRSISSGTKFTLITINEYLKRQAYSGYLNIRQRSHD